MATEGTYDDGVGAVYKIRVAGLVDVSWAVWFDGLTLTPQPNGETLIVGRVRDQAALHGILARIRDLNLPLLALRRVRDS
jgi:hypothetical protein